VSEARSFDETTVQPPTKSLHSNYGSNPSSRNPNDVSGYIYPATSCTLNIEHTRTSEASQKRLALSVSLWCLLFLAIDSIISHEELGHAIILLQCRIITNNTEVQGQFFSCGICSILEQVFSGFMFPIKIILSVSSLFAQITNVIASKGSNLSTCTKELLRMQW